MEKFLPYVRLTNAKAMGRSRSDKVRKGYVPILVGREDHYVEKLWLPTKIIGHPSIVALLNSSADEFGYTPQGVLKISHDVDPFKRMVNKISKTSYDP